MLQKSAVSAPERMSGSRETPLVTAVAANTSASAGMSWQQQQSFDEGRMMAAHLRGKAAGGTGGGPSSAPNAASSSSASAATLPSYFAERQTAAATALPPKMANGRVGQKAASSEDYGTGEEDGSCGGLATEPQLNQLLCISSRYHFPKLELNLPRKEEGGNLIKYATAAGLFWERKMSTLIRRIAIRPTFPPTSGLGLDSAAAMELAPLIRPETTKAAATVPTQLPGNSGRVPGSHSQGQEGSAAATSPFSFSSVPTPPPTYASAAAAASPLAASSARAKAAADPGTAGCSGGGDGNSFPQVHCTFNFQ